MNLKEIYLKVCEEEGWKPRFYISKTLEILSDAIDKSERILLVLKLPTGYGKTSITRVLARAAIEGNQGFSRVIHVMPMRTIIDDLYNELIKDVRIKEHVAKQYMHHPGSPFFAKKCIITTLDTFILNLFKLPAFEIHKVFKYDTSHFEFPRATIFTSIVVLDEFHLFSGLGSIEEENKSLTSVLVAIASLLEIGVPILVLTATLPSNIERMLSKKAKEVGVTFEKLEFNEEDEYNKIVSEKKRIIHLAFDRTAESIIEEKLKEGKSVMAVFNTVEQANKVYSKFKNEAILLHGKIPELIRSDMFSKLKSNKPRLLIGTQVIESGINVSYEVMVTELCPADRLVQRAGRIARNSGENYGEIWIVNSEKGPYIENVLKRTQLNLKEGKNLDYKYSNELIEKTYEEVPLKEYLELKHALEYLEFNPLFDDSTSKELYMYFKGFTDNFGIISAFTKSYIERELAVPLNEDEALNFFRKYREVVSRNNIEQIDVKEFEHVNKIGSLSIWLLLKGYEGIVISKEEFERISGVKLDGISVKSNESKVKNEEHASKFSESRKPCAATGQSLESHLERVQEYSLKVVEREAKVIARRLASVGIKLSEEDVKKIVKLVAILHDIGKASDTYQKNYDPNCRCIKECSFWLHEIPSAYLANKIIEPSLDTKLRKLVVLTVLLHLNAMRSFEDLARNVSKFQWKFKLHSQFICHYLNKHDIKIEIPEIIGGQDASKFLEEIRKYILQNKQNARFMRLYSLFFYPLCISDNLDAYENRKSEKINQSRLVFIEELKRVIIE